MIIYLFYIQWSFSFFCGGVNVGSQNAGYASKMLSVSICHKCWIMNCHIYIYIYISIFLEVKDNPPTNPLVIMQMAVIAFFHTSSTQST